MELQTFEYQLQVCVEKEEVHIMSYNILHDPHDLFPNLYLLVQKMFSTRHPFFSYICEVLEQIYG